MFLCVMRVCVCVCMNVLWVYVMRYACVYWVCVMRQCCVVRVFALERVCGVCVLRVYFVCRVWCVVWCDSVVCVMRERGAFVSVCLRVGVLARAFVSVLASVSVLEPVFVGTCLSVRASVVPLLCVCAVGVWCIRGESVWGALENYVCKWCVSLGLVCCVQVSACDCVRPRVCVSARVVKVSVCRGGACGIRVCVLVRVVRDRDWCVWCVRVFGRFSARVWRVCLVRVLQVRCVCVECAVVCVRVCLRVWCVRACVVHVLFCLVSCVCVCDSCVWWACVLGLSGCVSCASVVRVRMKYVCVCGACVVVRGALCARARMC